MKQRFEGRLEHVRTVRTLPGVARVTALPDGRFRVEVADASAIQRVLAELVSAGVTSIGTSRPSLEEVDVHMIGDRGLEV